MTWSLGFNTSDAVDDRRSYDKQSAPENRIALSGSLTAYAHKASPFHTGETRVGKRPAQPQRTKRGQ